VERDLSSDDVVLARIWSALAEVEDPEIPVSVVDMGLIVGVAYAADRRTVELQLTYTAMGCPAMDLIQEDIRARLLADSDVDAVTIEVVWDPVWTPERLSARARATMRELGLAA
jgi:metal-sulfur cluster biosynthetic enzyme